MNRLTTLVMMTAAEMANSLAGAGHTYAMTHAASSLSPAAKHKEAMGGVTQVRTKSKGLKNRLILGGRNFMDGFNYSNYSHKIYEIKCTR